MTCARSSITHWQKHSEAGAKRFRQSAGWRHTSLPDHEPISARPGGFRYEAGLFLRRNWLASTAAIAVIAALSLGLAGTIWQAEKAQRERDAAIQERERLRAMQQATFVMFSEAGDAGGELDARRSGHQIW